MSDRPLWIGGEAVARLLPVGDAVDALEAALQAGLDPSADPARSAVATASGHLLLMPSEVGPQVGVKVVSVAPANPGRGRPRIQAVYLLLDGDTLTPLALIDGTSLTSLRTPALSALAVRHLTAYGAQTQGANLVVFGIGPQAWGHVQALRTVRCIAEVVVVGRDAGRTRQFVDHLAATGVSAAVGRSDAVARADLVVCATTAATPLFAADAVSPHACVVAVGSHEPDRRELPGDLLGRSAVVVEEVRTALREAGDVVGAVTDGTLDPAALLPLADVVTGAVSPPPGRPRVFKSVGMAWEDLVVAAEVYRRRRSED